MATATRVVSAAAKAAAEQFKRQADKRALARFAEFWAALQVVGDALHEAEKLAKRAQDGPVKAAGRRHWDIASAEEVGSALRRARFALRILSASAKKFEPQLIHKDWRR